MATYIQESERKFKLLAFNGYKPNGQKRTKSKRISVPDTIPKRGIRQFVQAQADGFEREFKYGYSEDAQTTFEAYKIGWLQRQHRYKPTTLATYRATLELCSAFIGQIKLKDIRPLTIEYLAEMLRKRSWRGKNITERTVKKYLVAVGTVLEDAKRNEIIPFNAVRRVSLPRTEETEQSIPSATEMRRLMDCIRREPLLYRLYFTLAITTGCRRGELCALRWCDVQGQLLRIAKSRSRVTGLGVVETDTKNHRTRYAPLYAGTKNLLTEYYHDCCRAEFNEHGCLIHEEQPPDQDDYIFVEDGKPLQPDTFSRRLRKLYKRGGFSPEYHLHTLRHFFASYLLNSGVSNKVTADILGHGDTGFLERTYGHSLPEYSEAAVNCIGNLFGGVHGEAFQIEAFRVELMQDLPNEAV